MMQPAPSYTTLLFWICSLSTLYGMPEACYQQGIAVYMILRSLQSLIHAIKQGSLKRFVTADPWNLHNFTAAREYTLLCWCSHFVHATVLRLGESTNHMPRSDWCHHQYTFRSFAGRYQLIREIGDHCIKAIILFMTCHK